MKRIAVSLLISLVPLAQAQTRTALSARELANLPLEDLANIEVTSVSRHPERLSDAAASIYVITADSIRRSGVTSLPEALRLAPNLQVARLDAGQYAITARGFNNGFGNKLLVLIDGRTVYAPFFSGVFWDQQDVMLEDIERIEVISGPGATLWGANAVNGVINVITRTAAATQGGLAVVGGGNRGVDVGVRWGAAFGESGRFRIYAKTSQVQNTERASGSSVADGWDRHQIGWRADWIAAGGGFTLQGDAYDGKSEHRGFFGPFELRPIKVSGANVLARWTRRFDDNSDIRVQAYVDHTERDDALLYSPKADIVDLEFQHTKKMGRHELLWGGGHRRAKDDIRPGVFFGFIPASSTMNWTNLFVQDQYEITADLDLTLGAKLEHNEFTGTEKLPSARLAWKLSNDRLAWASVSRAVRAPARLDRELFLPPKPPFLIAGGPDFVSEVANVFELGYRDQPTPVLNYSITLFQHRWDRLRSGQRPPNAQVQNMIDGTTQGVEAWASWQLSANWRIHAGLTTLHKDLQLKAGSTDPDGPKNLGNDPSNQWVLRSAFNLPRGQELDLAVRRVAALPSPAVPAYTALDLHYAYPLRPNLELSVTGQNLFDNSHAEFNADPARSEIGRSLSVKVKWMM